MMEHFKSTGNIKPKKHSVKKEGLNDKPEGENKND